jgi:hypothetical protein
VRGEISHAQPRHPVPARRARAHIRVYSDLRESGAQPPKALANVPVDATLRKAGYRPTTVTSQQEFDSAMGRGGWDLVLIDVADRSVINRAPNSSAPIVLPVVFNGTSAELAAVKKQYQHILKAPTKNQSFLDAIDDALALKPPAPGKAEDKSGR